MLDGRKQKENADLNEKVLGEAWDEAMQPFEKYRFDLLHSGTTDFRCTEGLQLVRVKSILKGFEVHGSRVIIVYLVLLFS